LGAPVQVE
jgi:hypothetical protein